MDYAGGGGGTRGGWGGMGEGLGGGGGGGFQAAEFVFVVGEFVDWGSDRRGKRLAE